MNKIMNRNKIQPATISRTLGAGSTASPFYWWVTIEQPLCCKTCADNTPVFSPQFSLESVENVGADQYVVTIHVEGIISYVPCGGGCCNTKTQPVSQNFTIPIASTETPTVTIAQGTTANSIVAKSCQPCSRDFLSVTPLTVTVATAS